MAGERGQFSSRLGFYSGCRGLSRRPWEFSGVSSDGIQKMGVPLSSLSIYSLSPLSAIR
ncbi:MAG: hypothetical protein CM1200mP40_29850 [Gammaproteobacteria bacterium]|nr:MAG: hypothetical protein CM1200mP40_29850 [Gammaproteobacteria bacterium]